VDNEQLAALLKNQKSLTEWLEDIKHKDAEAIRQEDNNKRERLKVLNRTIGLPFDEPTQFEAADLAQKTPAFQKYLQEHGAVLCALRLNPKQPNLPKLRMRGKSVKAAYAWFAEQNIDPSKYSADFIPHAISTLATIFIVNKHGIQGEIIVGGHTQLTQGFHDASVPVVFRYDFKEWALHPYDKRILQHLQEITALIHVPDHAKQQKLAKSLGTTFFNDYLAGYFETTETELGTWYIDYNQSLGEMYADMVIRTAPAAGKALVSGQTGSAGQAEGPVCIVLPDNLGVTFPKNGVLVCPVTTPDYVPLMQKAAAIVTDQGGILSHAAIVARELHKPCIVGTGNATKELKDNDIVLVDANQGTVKKVG
jgi:phosphohistidine swiveling domain-containing protein